VYLDYWKLKYFPFEDDSSPGVFFETDGRREISEDLAEGIARRKGALMLTGEVGCGKTMLCQRILLALPEDRYDIALITWPRLETVELLREINRQLGLETKDDGKGGLLHVLQQHLAANAASGRDTIICIDDAQDLPSTVTLEELRLLLNFRLPNRFLLTLLLIGQPEFAVTVAKVEALDQRIALRLHVGPFGLQETVRYILHRLKLAGRSDPIFSRQAADLVYRHTGGVPRRINHLMDLCLLLGMRKGYSMVNSALVCEAMERFSWRMC